MTREDFIFCIGYRGNQAVVDLKALKIYGRLSTRELADKGLYKAAFCSAVFAETVAGGAAAADDMNWFVSFFNKVTKASHTRNGLNRLFGVFGVPVNVTRIRAV